MTSERFGGTHKSRLYLENFFDLFAVRFIYYSQDVAFDHILNGSMINTMHCSRINHFGISLCTNELAQAAELTVISMETTRQIVMLSVDK